MRDNYENETLWRSHYRTPYLGFADCDFLMGLLQEFRVKLINRYQ